MAAAREGLKRFLPTAVEPASPLPAGDLAMSPIRLLAATVLLLMALRGAAAADRITVTAPPMGQDAAEELAGSLAGACNRGDFIGFIGHFTPGHGARIRQRMEDIFVAHEPRMDILKVTLLSETENEITFGVRYAWHPKDKPEQVLASKVTARKVEGVWKLDGEQVKSVSRTAAESDYGDTGAAAPFNPFNPPADLIDPDLEHLRGDIGIRPGGGCANGRCGQ
jgi:hypothetical protein